MPDGRARAESESLFDRLGLRPGPDVPAGELSRGNSHKVVLGLLGDDHPAHLAGPLVVLSVETAVLSVALVAVAIRVTRQRS
ncbi:MAG TPA: hypothetical protein VH573_06555 [Mycobacteriales bacterium]